MLTSCASVAPRGVFVTATGATSSGLTVTLTRESNEFVLEGGALVLADRGACCIDEFDKMTGHQVRRTKMHRICNHTVFGYLMHAFPSSTKYYYEFYFSLWMVS